jgi:DNA ligase-1
MTWKMMSNLLEATDQQTPSRQILMISKALENFEDKSALLSVLALEYESNNIGVARAKKWLANAFDVHDEEVEGDFNVYEDMGDVAYYMDSSAEGTNVASIRTVLNFLGEDCSGIGSDSYRRFSALLLSMSAIERRWFLRYWLRTPRNGINVGNVVKILAKHFGKKQAEVKKHTTFNTVANVCEYYMADSEPPMILNHGTFVAPMLAKAVPLSKWPKNKIVDYKYDGNRYQIHKKGDNVIIFNRKGKIVTQQYPDIVEIVRGYDCDNSIFDGEIYPVNEDGTPAPHQRLGTRVHSKDHAEAAQRCPVEWVIFDCLKMDGKAVISLSYTHRLEVMKGLSNQAHRQFDGDAIAFYHEAINAGFEGIIVKDADAEYQPGKRSVSWAKHKPPRIELDVVILSATYGEGKRAGVFGSYEIGVRDGGSYSPIGWVGTGFSDSDLIRLTNDLRRNVESFANGKHNFLPRVVLEVSADLVTRDAKGNIGLRFPRVTRIRDDKFPQDANTINDVLEMI